MKDLHLNTPSHDWDYARARAYLIELKTRGVTLGLDRTRRFATALGNPERAVPCVHVAGTNGKGSVCAMLDAIFRAAGWRTGLYTSPHLVKLGERVQVNRRILTEQEIVAYTKELQSVVRRMPGGVDEQPSYFEFMTALAFVHFARERCDVAIIETGLGGRLDATNIVEPQVSVITSIGLDHCEFLGHSLEEIAAEKAGIIKPGRPVVIGRMPAAAETVIRDIAAGREAPIVSVAAEFGNDLDDYPQTNLRGDYQRWNAAAATLVARVLPSAWRLTDDRLTHALMHVEWAGRWQRVCVGTRAVVLDASHNAEGAEMLDCNLRRLAVEFQRAPVVIVGVLGATRAKPIIEALCRHAREIHLVVPDQPRACSHSDLEAAVPDSFRGRVRRATVQALFPLADVCTAGEEEDAIVVTGSIYLVGEVMARLDPAHGPNEGWLQDF